MLNLLLWLKNMGTDKPPSLSFLICYELIPVCMLMLLSKLNRSRLFLYEQILSVNDQMCMYGKVW